jgi:hypothetical protein
VEVSTTDETLHFEVAPHQAPLEEEQVKAGDSSRTLRCSGSPGLMPTSKVGQQTGPKGPNPLRGFWYTFPLPRNRILHLESFHHAVEPATTSQAFPSRWFADAGSTLISTLLRPKKSAVPIFRRMLTSHERSLVAARGHSEPAGQIAAPRRDVDCECHGPTRLTNVTGPLQGTSTTHAIPSMSS